MVEIEHVNIGRVPNDGQGDTPRVSFAKVNRNMAALVAALSDVQSAIGAAVAAAAAATASADQALSKEQAAFNAAFEALFVAWLLSRPTAPDGLGTNKVYRQGDASGGYTLFVTGTNT
ncbi:hypothetical protein [Methylobacterium nodulans]|uniref:Uncharacterized protein n=1 Tax=Methylobacterium nodulans (strain LMG 21967 / CNCM I-2342 / ORS 2060) TaxID=460265 RepID=B8ICJ9_METNO|nr:hypothetical protein [Methylobacterium nodulans]ACL57410.1 hypothetical protein Mnod_2440 [Methylobacterium nodulans ORS 2060]